jgi:hypothetical protein
MRQQQEADGEADYTGKESILEKIEMFIFRYYSKLLVYPDNKKLKYFHLIVAVTLFFDFYMTGLILGNYLFIIGE